MIQKKTVSVYGYGRFGKLWADILSNDFHVKVYSRRGLLPEEVNPGVEIVSLAELHKCDALFYCVAISSLEEVLIETKQYHNPSTLYFDTCSVKLKPVEWLTTHLPQGSRIIATHPMFGPDSYYRSAEPLAMVMCNVNADPATVVEWGTYFSGKRMRVEHTSADEHDRLIAYSQGVTHFVGRVLSEMGVTKSAFDTLGYTKLLEIVQQTCNDSLQLFKDLQAYNPYTRAMRTELQDAIKRVEKILD